MCNFTIKLKNVWKNLQWGAAANNDQLKNLCVCVLQTYADIIYNNTLYGFISRNNLLFDSNTINSK